MMFRRIYILGALFILLISMVFIMQYSSMNNIIIRNKELNIEKSRELLGQKINSELKLYAMVIESAANMITNNNWNEEEITYNLEKVYRENPTFSLLYYGDTNNHLLNSINWKMPSGYDIRERPWYIKALEQKDVVYSEAYLDLLTGKLAISIAKPVYDSDRKIKGVVGGDILIDRIVQIVEESRSNVSDMGYSFLIDGDGNILAHPDYAYVDDPSLKNIEDLSPELYKEMKMDIYGKKQITMDETEGFLSYQPIENTDWIIGSFASFTEYDARHKYLLGTLFMALLGALLILLIFLVLQNKYFIRPLKSLVQDIETIDFKKDISYRMLLNEKDPFIAPRQSLNKSLEHTEYFFRQQQEYAEELLASQEELESQNQQLYHLSYYDHLTGLYNRGSFERMITKTNLEKNLPLGIIMADVNGLKLINDSFGHDVGDELLKATGKILLRGCGQEKLVFRMGGDEFVIILPQTSLEATENFIKRIRDLSQGVSLHNIELSISFGVAIKYKKDEDISDVIKKAEDDMYSNKILEGPSMRSKTIDTIVQTLYEKNAREEAHSTRVSALCKEMGIELGMTNEQVKQLETVGLLHDIGKIAISNSLLEKQGSLSEEEWMEVQKHPEIGYRILSTTSEMAQIAEYALSHHERYDGKGYPQGLKGEEIPLVSRIITIADAYDAMISDRPYRKGLPEEVATAEIIKNVGIQFDAALAKVFIEKVLNKGGEEIKN